MKDESLVVGGMRWKNSIALRDVEKIEEQPVYGCMIPRVPFSAELVKIQHAPIS